MYQIFKYCRSFIIFLPLTAFSQIITTVAGNGTFGYSGDGGQGAMAQLNQTTVVTDRSGNLFIADTDNNVIRKVDNGGIISNFAGTGILGFSGNGGLAVNAMLYRPSRMAMDNEDNLYFTDQNGSVIRRIDKVSGVITSITGGHPSGYSGDGGPLLDARFRTLSAISFDQDGNLYLSDTHNNVIRKVTVDGIINTVVGNGTRGFAGDGGLAINAQLASIYNVIFDHLGNMYIADAGNQRIRKVNTAGIISTFAGNGSIGEAEDDIAATDAPFKWPWSIDIDNDDNIYIADGSSFKIRKITADGIISTYAGNGVYGNSGDGGLAKHASLGYPFDVKVDQENNVFISITENFYVVKKVTNCLSTPITILQQPDDIILCNNGNAQLSVSADNVQQFQWQVRTGNTWVNITDGANYSGTAGNQLSITGITDTRNGQQFRCVMTGACGDLFSRTVKLVVNTAAIPTLVVLADQQEICEGTLVTFSTVAQYAGNTPFYSWTKNGVSVGNNSAIYTDLNLNNGDIVRCTLTSNAACITTPTAASLPVPMVVQSKQTPLISIVGSANDICYNTPVNFTASATHPGLTPDFTWTKNGVTVGTNAASYMDNGLQQGDIIQCSLESSLTCVTSPLANSNDIVMLIKPLLTPALTINTTTPRICETEVMTFNATAVHGGTTPEYQWLLNGSTVGSNNASFSMPGLKNGDFISCRLTSSEGCVSTPTAASNVLTAVVHANPVLSLDKTSTLCTGASRTLDAGNFASYSWNNGSSDRRITINNLGQYAVTVTDANGCKATDVVDVNMLLQPPAKFLPADTAICAYGDITLRPLTSFVNYNWNNGAKTATITVKQAGAYWLEVTGSNGCVGKDTIQVLPKACLQGFFMPNAFTPNRDGKNELLKPIVLGNIIQYQFWVYNRWGQVVFYSKDPAKGWDGSIKGTENDTQAMVWMCTYQFEGEPVQQKKGTVVLIK